MKDNKMAELVKKALETPPAFQQIREITAEEITTGKIFDLQENIYRSYTTIFTTDMDECNKKLKKVIEGYLGKKV